MRCSVATFLASGLLAYGAAAAELDITLKPTPTVLAERQILTSSFMSLSYITRLALEDMRMDR